MNEEFGIKEVELEKIVVQYVISEGNGISLYNLRKAFKIAIDENNKAIKEDIQKMIDEAVEKKLANK
ncbi:MAG TPA: hypothetical protein VFK37_08750 [Bacillales bacterium]|nr:hypothetical protein [Bacillales bacterium]